MSSEILVPVVLAGGSGTRLWPASRSRFPKHLAPLVGDTSLLQQTVERAEQICRTRKLLVIGSASQGDLIERQLRDCAEPLEDRLVLEPAARNTAAAVAVAALQAKRSYGEDAVLFICPSDHLVGLPQALAAAVDAGLVAARDGRLVTFGIQPDRPETGFGYIELGEPFEEAQGVLSVRRFVEKPKLSVAQAMIADRRHVWNSGMFLMRADVVLAELQHFEPELTEAARSAFDARDPTNYSMSLALFQKIKSMPIDKAVMERSNRVAVVPCDIGWSDLGSWHALWEIMEKDADGNGLQGDILAESSKDNIVRASHRLVTLAGVANLAVIETADAVLVADRNRSEGIKAIVERLTDAGRSEADVHLKSAEPWGETMLVRQSDDYSAMELVIDADREAPTGAISDFDFGVVLRGNCRIKHEENTTSRSAGEFFLIEGQNTTVCADKEPATLMVFKQTG